jgi:hypothetical protein
MLQPPTDSIYGHHLNFLKGKMEQKFVSFII